MRGTIGFNGLKHRSKVTFCEIIELKCDSLANGDHSEHNGIGLVEIYPEMIFFPFSEI